MVELYTLVPFKPPPHRTVHVDLGSRSYDVVIGRGFIPVCGEFLVEQNLIHFYDRILTSTSVVFIADASVFPLFENALKSNFLFRCRGTFDVLTVPSGEPSKSGEAAARLHSELARLKLARSSLIIALGGGVIGDLAGFVAATYLRGIAFVQVPTTLLAMVDSSVGGKTGVNLPEGKNLVGAFHQPKLVVADLDTLKTLPPREFAAGMAEVIKYGAIKDKALFDRVAKGVKPDDKDLDEIVEKCVAIKARIVENDEFETKGERALLNFGHTIGHAIEKATEYKSYLHGEAISLGMRAAAWLSVWQAGLPEADARRIEAALTANALPVTLKPEVDRAAILAALGNDKKVAADGKNRWVLLKSLGQATSGWELPDDPVEKAINLLALP
jgi:3-dehydroquinate synthase